jgi:uncharacterized membrane protein YeaQ/YmgE (transglycosylase-associated protein family)
LAWRAAAFAAAGRVVDMNSIPWLADLKDLSGFELTFLVLIVVIATFATGFVTHVITQSSGFGPIPNGILALVGACGGIYLRYRLFAAYRGDDVALTIGMAIAGALLLLFALILVKSRVF